MTLALVTLVNDVDLSPTPGLSVRAARAVLRSMARVAGDDGQFRYGMRQAKVAALAEYSAATIKRAQRFLVERGLLERVAVGGGRCSTRWRICVERLRPVPAPPAPPAPAPPPPRLGPPRASWWSSPIQQLGRGEPALERTQIFSDLLGELHPQRPGQASDRGVPARPARRTDAHQGPSLVPDLSEGGPKREIPQALRSTEETGRRWDEPLPHQG